MKHTGITVLSIGLIGLAMVIGIAKLSMHLAAIQGSYYSSWTKYLHPELLFPVIIVIAIGLVLNFKKSNQK